jgi:8-oxo-dGTP pyrophosphatase MutT (NUDIX family)
LELQELRMRLTRRLNRDPLSVETLMAGAKETAGDHSLNMGTLPRSSAVEPAAVLVPIVLRKPEPAILLTKRADHLTRHAGQISFPGGRLHTEDRDLVATALRETREEIGINTDEIEIAGFLDSYETGTGFRILPVVGFVAPGYTVKLDAREVETVFEVPFSFLMNPDNHQRHVGNWN